VLEAELFAFLERTSDAAFTVTEQVPAIQAEISTRTSNQSGAGYVTRAPFTLANE